MNNLNIIERHNRNVTVLDLAGKIRMGEDVNKLAMTLRVVVADGEKNILLNMTKRKPSTVFKFLPKILKSLSRTLSPGSWIER